MYNNYVCVMQREVRVAMSQEVMRVNGGYELNGEVSICGGKNAALAVIPAALLTDDICVIENLPSVSDISVLADMLRHVGAKVTLEKRRMVVDASGLSNCEAPAHLARLIRSSSYFLGALLGRLGMSKVAMPGGCAIGERKIDLHIKGFEALGATVIDDGEMVSACAKKLTGTEIFLDLPSVGATVNIMLAAVLAEGSTLIVNAAKEPHIVDLANMLNSMGAYVRGAGTDIIRIRGMKRLHGCTYTIIPDQIETGTLMIAAAAARGDITIHGAIPVHMEALSAKLLEMGVRVFEGDDMIRILSTGMHRAINVKTLPYPGFPTDLQQPMASLLTIANGVSEINETLYDNRHKHIPELVKMGASATVHGQIAQITGVPRLHGACVTATDLRAGAALVIAGLMAEGVTEISNIHYIDRGYEGIEEKLRSLNARIERVHI